jgi:hypothetical protein
VSERWLVGLDLGQAADPSALAAVVQTLVARHWEHHVRSLFRWSLGTSYVAVVDDVERFVSREPLWGCTLVVDATGCGRPVVDLLRDRRLPVNLVPATISGGAHSSFDVNGASVAKRELVAVINVLLGQRRLWIAAGLDLGPTLEGEFSTFRSKITATGHEQLEAPWREGAHDDLLLAASLALWYGERRPPPTEQSPVVLVPGRVDPASGADWMPAFAGKVGALGDYRPPGDEARPPMLGPW